jgi:hypothetical protein
MHSNPSTSAIFAVPAPRLLAPSRITAATTKLADPNNKFPVGKSNPTTPAGEVSNYSDVARIATNLDKMRATDRQRQAFATLHSPPLQALETANLTNVVLTEEEEEDAAEDRRFDLMNKIIEMNKKRGLPAETRTHYLD